jgi:hypothetical protein
MGDWVELLGSHRAGLYFERDRVCRLWLWQVRSEFRVGKGGSCIGDVGIGLKGFVGRGLWEFQILVAKI